MTDYLYISMDVDCDLWVAQALPGPQAWRTLSVGQGKGFTYVEQAKPLVLDRFGLLIPCDRTVTAAICDFLDLQRLLARRPDHEGAAFGPYYFTMTMKGNSDFENEGTPARALGGPRDTAYAGALQPTAPPQQLFKNWLSADGQRPVRENNPEDLPFARYNCWTGCQGIAQYVGGVDLGCIAPALAHSWRLRQARLAFEEMFEELAYGAGAQTILSRDGIVAARHHGGPPFIMLSAISAHRERTLDETLALPLPGGETLGAWMDRQRVFTRAPLSEHLHKINKPPQP